MERKAKMEQRLKSMLDFSLLQSFSEKQEEYHRMREVTVINL